MLKKVPKQFFLFLTISVLFWLLITFSKTYKSTVKYDVVFENLPQNKMFVTNPPKRIGIQVQASGFKLIQTHLLHNLIHINVSNLENVKGNTYQLILDTQKSNIESQLLNGVEVIGFEETVMLFNISKLASKKVALVAQTNINFLPGYGLVKPLQIIPDSILISGSKFVLDTLHKLHLKNTILDNVNQHFLKEVEVENPKGINLKFDTKKVKLKGTVDKITEGSIDIEYSIVNKPRQVKITTLVNKVTIVFVVALADFNKINNKSFEVECDYQLSINENLTHLLPKIVSKPNFVKSVKIIPETIDFLIQK